LEEEEAVVPVETGVEDATTVASVIGTVVVGIMTTGVVEVVGAGEEVSWMKTAPMEDDKVVAGAWVAIGVLEVVGTIVGAEVDAGTRAGVPSIVIVPTAAGAPVTKDPSASSVTVTTSVTITLSITTYRSLFRTSYRPANTSLTSKEAKIARLEKVAECIL
jgi:hypothetical protein